MEAKDEAEDHARIAEEKKASEEEVEKQAKEEAEEQARVAEQKRAKEEAEKKDKEEAEEQAGAEGEKQVGAPTEPSPQALIAAATHQDASTTGPSLEDSIAPSTPKASTKHGADGMAGMSGEESYG